jgi:hypothetical protein
LVEVAVSTHRFSSETFSALHCPGLSILSNLNIVQVNHGMEAIYPEVRKLGYGSKGMCGGGEAVWLWAVEM